MICVTHTEKSKIGAVNATRGSFGHEDLGKTNLLKKVNEKSMDKVSTRTRGRAP
jgi:hypothetical protein